MKRLNYLAGVALALTGMASTGAFAAPAWGPSGEASYEEHQAQPVSHYTRAQVQTAYLQAAAAGMLPRTAEVVSESPAELVLAATPMPMTMAAATPAQEPAAVTAPAPASAPEQTLSYASPPDAQVLARNLTSRAGDADLPVPGLPQAPLQASPDMISKDQDLALSEGEEQVAGDATRGTLALQ